jgi:hypothetical protein
VPCSHRRPVAHTTTDSAVRMITSAVATHVALVVHYHLHATTTFPTNPIFVVEYLGAKSVSMVFWKILREFLIYESPHITITSFGQPS